MEAAGTLASFHLRKFRFGETLPVRGCSPLPWARLLVLSPSCYYDVMGLNKTWLWVPPRPHTKLGQPFNFLLRLRGIFPSENFIAGAYSDSLTLSVRSLPWDWPYWCKQHATKTASWWFLIIVVIMIIIMSKNTQQQYSFVVTSNYLSIK